ncbi:HNH endonuclease [Luteolibacter ambystomatis]|uniref:HNH endonuclease n=1 Tax=Luteolibacter ambystomatis TaxID=2824561 RepID=A0A975IYK8_9BACT|nr:RHS repeat-associated core domain-containing protein [Luteolibacter ambystomatis]QUE50342.1 HNH endonuclease [Luteolibacter ambystomatis]
MKFIGLFRGVACVAAAILTIGATFAQTNSNATGARITRGLVPAQRVIIPADQQKGIALGETGNNADLFGDPNAAESTLPWFCRTQRTDLYVSPGPGITMTLQNPAAAYGDAGGGTPLYTDREYRLGVYGGGRSTTNKGVFRIRAYQKSQFSGTAVGVLPSDTTEFELPVPGEPAWSDFLAAGGKKEISFHGLQLFVEIYSEITQQAQQAGNFAPYVITHRGSDPDYYYIIDYKGWILPGTPMASTSNPVLAANAAFQPMYAINFTSRSPWKSKYIDLPHFTGEPLPSEYLGLSQQELSGVGGYAPPAIPSSYQSATVLDDTPELRQHPKLDKLVDDLNNDPVAIANYVHNEIALIDPLGYNEDGQTDPRGIWAGGMNRSAFGTYMEGAGNPWEQCALLVYMLRKANVPAVYVEPHKDDLLMLDTQLEKILGLRVQGAVDNAGQARMPVEVPVHYPWVAAWIQSENRWVHLYPWIKDTSVVEGENLYDYFPDDCKSGVEWVAKYLKGNDSNILTDQVSSNLPNGNGDFVIEAENFNENIPSTAAPASQWFNRDTDDVGGWMQAVNRDNLKDYNGPPENLSLDTAPVLEYVLDIPVATTYYVWIKGNASSAAGAPPRFDKCRIFFDGTLLGSADLPNSAGWNWAGTKTTGGKISFSASSTGRHKIRIGVESVGFGVDKILVTTNSSFTPTGDGGEGSKRTSVLPNVPSFQFKRFATQQLASKGVNYEDVGMKYLDRKLNRTSFDEFPRPYRLNAAAHTVYGRLIDRPNTFDTVRVVVNRVANPAENIPAIKLDSEEWFSMDLHCRPFFVHTGGGIGSQSQPSYGFKLGLWLFPYRGKLPISKFVNPNPEIGDFHNSGNRTWMQVQSAYFGYVAPYHYPNSHVTKDFINDPTINIEVIHVRQSRYLRGDVASVEMLSQGAGYTSAPTVIIDPPANIEKIAGYRNAVGIATISNGAVTGVTISDPGYGYDYDVAPPKITFQGGGGANATGVVHLSTPSQPRSVDSNGVWTSPLGVNPKQVIISRPVIADGDLGAICLTFGRVSQRMLDYLAECYRQVPGAPTQQSDMFKSAASAYLMGMEYYKRVGEFAVNNSRLHKHQVFSYYAAGLSKLQASIGSYFLDVDSNGKSFHAFNCVFPGKYVPVSAGPYPPNQIPPGGYTEAPAYVRASVDMFFSEVASASRGMVHTDNDLPQDPHRTDMTQLMISEISAQEHQVINDYYKEAASVSTVKLLQRAQALPERVSPNTGVLTLTKNNYASEGEKTYTKGAVSKKLKDWAPSIWSEVQTAFNDPQEGDYAKAYITPGNVNSAGLSYDGVGAMVLQPSVTGAYITSGPNYTNGGFGSTFDTPYYGSDYIGGGTLSLGSSGYSYSYFDSGSSYVAPASYSTWDYSSTYSNLSSSIYSPTNYQTYAWTQQATDYGFSSLGISDYFRETESRGAMGSSSFFGSIMVTGFSTYEAVYNGIGGAISSVGGGIDSVGRFISDNMSSTVGGWVSDPVDVVRGDFYVDAIDLTLPGPMPLQLRRNYSSLSTSDSQFGHGWKSSIMPFIGVSEDSDLLYAAEADGSVIAYRVDAADPTAFVPTMADNPSLKNLNEGGAGTSSNPMNNRIVKSTEGSSTIYTLSGPNGGVRRFKVKSFPIGSGANAITRERPYLESWKDAQGNMLSFTYYGDGPSPDTGAADYGQLAKISASNGNALGFNYDTYGHIAEAWTQDGRRVAYEYDLQGDLVKVTLPDGATHQYAYGQETTVASGETVQTSNHLLIRESKPEGRMLENDYDDSRRVIKQRAIVDSSAVPVQNAEFIYANTKNETTKTLSGTTTVKDAYGRSTVFTYVDGLITSEDDPETPAETREWYGANETGAGAYPRSLKKITDRRGVVKAFKYDSKGNVIEKSLGTDATPADIDGDGVASSGEKSVTTWTYNDRCLPVTQTDPSGMTTKWFYDDSLYPYLASRVEKWVGATLVSKVVRQFGARTGTSRYAKGLVEWEKTAEGSADESRIDWDYDDRGFATVKTSRTGTDDPDVAVLLKHNLRGELIEEKQTGAGDRPDQKWSYTYDAMGRRTIAQRQAGSLKSIVQTYYTLNGEVEWTDGMRTGVNDRVLNRYDKNGRLSERLQWLSAAKADGSGVETPQGDAAVATTFYSYDKFNNLIEVRTPRRNSIAAEYDGIGRATRVDYYSGYKGSGGVVKASRWLAYEPGGQVSQETSTLGGVTKCYYNARGQLRKRENSDGSIHEWRYYADGRPAKEILPNGSYKELVYDDANRTVTERLKSSAGTVLKTAVSVFDRRGNLTSETKGGFTTTTAYDGLSRPRTITGPPATSQAARRIDIFRYPDPLGRETRMTNALNEVTISLSDALGRVESVEIQDSAGHTVSKATTSYTPDFNGTTTTVGTGADALVSHTWTDTAGNVVLQSMADGTYSTTTYEAGETPIVQRDRAGNITTRTFDWQGNVLSEVRPGALQVNMVYDGAGNLLERQMPGGMTEKSIYDTAGRLTSNKLAQGTSTTRLTTFDYYPASHAWAGMLKSSTNAANVITTNAYDDCLRLASSTSTGPDPEDALTKSITYDELGNPNSISETGIGGTTVVTRSSDSSGLLLNETVSVGGTVQSDISQTLDAAGRRTGRTIADFTQTFGYRADGRMISTSVGSQTFASGFSTAGLLASRSGPYQNEAIGRDTLGRTTSRGLRVAGSLALQETTPQIGTTLGWSALDKVNQLQINRWGAGAWNELRKYEYDASYRLVSESYPQRPGASGNEVDQFYYDSNTFKSTGGAGVLVGRKRQSDGLAWKSAQLPVSGDFAREKSVTYEGKPRPVALSGTAFGAQTVRVDVDGVPAAVTFPGWQDSVGAWSASVALAKGSHTLTAVATHPSGWTAPAATSQFTVAPQNDVQTVGYDEIGRVISRSWTSGMAQALTWDPAGRLVKVVQTGVNPSVWTALYDGLNRRIRTTFTPQGSQTFTVREVYDPNVEFLSIGQGVSTGSGAVGWSWKAYSVDRSGSFGGLGGLGGLQAVRDSAGIWRGIASDWWGNTVGWFDTPGGALQWSNVRFGAWGAMAGWNTAVQDSAVPLHQLLGYRGLTTDPPGFLQMGLRPYEPVSGTWLAPDPMGHAGSLSLYDYCGNDPINQADPDGRFGKAVERGGAWVASTGNAISAGVAQALTGYSGPGGLTGSQIYTNYMFSPAGQLHAQQLDLAFEWIPGVNVAKWAVEGVTGRNFFTGADLTAAQQISSTFNASTAILSTSIGLWESTASSSVGAGSVFTVNPDGPKVGFQNSASNPYSPVSAVEKMPAVPGFCFVGGTEIATAAGARTIESLQVGDRVLTTDDASTTEVDPASWKKITLRMPNPECPSDLVDLSLLRSDEWIALTGAAPGRQVWIALEEMGLQGFAEVREIAPCPRISEGTGRVVLSTITHLNTFVMEVRMQGRADTLRLTDRHRLYSATRQDWVATSELKPGEELRTREGVEKVESVLPVTGIHRVYNLEVETVHSYFAGDAKVLSHNESGCSATSNQVGHLRNATGGVDFSNSPHLYPVGEGQSNIVQIEYTGTRSRDYKAANIAAGLGETSKAPQGYTWHHLDDYDPVTNTGSMQLVERPAHEATYPHRGGVSQYESAFGVPYDLSDPARASIRAAGLAIPGK